MNFHKKEEKEEEQYRTKSRNACVLVLSREEYAFGKYQ